MSWIKDFLNALERLLTKEPPYWIFLFISTFFVIVSLISGNHFKEVWAFFLYSVVGTLWRHSEKDISSAVKGRIELEEDSHDKEIKLKKFEILRRTIYHVVNLVLLILLFLYLGYL